MKAGTTFELVAKNELGERTLASYAAMGKGEFRAYVQPVAVGDALPAMPLFLTPDWYVNVPLEPTYQEAWHRFPKQLRGLLEGPAG